MAFARTLWTGLVTRVKGKVAAAIGLYNRVYIGVPTLTDVPTAYPLGWGLFACVGAPVNGTSGTHAGNATPGSLMVRLDSPALYQNTNTQASPTWTAAPLTGVAGITSGTITGATFDNGVIGGGTPAAGTFTALGVTGLSAWSVTNAITASVTQTQVGATGLTTIVNRITTVANAGDAARLAALTAGQFQIVYNDGAHPASVFPATSGNIDGAGANAAVTLTNGKRAIFVCVAANTIVSAQLGVVSA